VKGPVPRRAILIQRKEEPQIKPKSTNMNQSFVFNAFTSKLLRVPLLIGFSTAEEYFSPLCRDVWQDALTLFALRSKFQAMTVSIRVAEKILPFSTAG